MDLFPTYVLSGAEWVPKNNNNKEKSPALSMFYHSNKWQSA